MVRDMEQISNFKLFSPSPKRTMSSSLACTDVAKRISYRTLSLGFDISPSSYCQDYLRFVTFQVKNCISIRFMVEHVHMSCCLSPHIIKGKQ